MSKYRLLIKFILILTMFFFSALQAAGEISMADYLLKVNNEPTPIYNINKSCFAFYDAGDRNLKIFDWNFKPVKEFSIKQGEGPGEIKYKLRSICQTPDAFIINSLHENNIKIYDKNGNYKDTIPLDFSPTSVLYRHEKLYLLTASFNPKEESSFIGAIMNPESFKIIEKIHIKNKLETDPDFDWGKGLLGQSCFFEIDDAQNFLLMMRPTNTIYKLDAQGNLKSKTRLPVKYRMTVKSFKNDKGEVRTYVSFSDFQFDLKIVEGSIFFGFLEKIENKKNDGERLRRTLIIKLNENGTYTKKTLDGIWSIVGSHKARMYLFNSDDYKIESFDFQDWN